MIITRLLILILMLRGEQTHYFVSIFVQFSIMYRIVICKTKNSKSDADNSFISRSRDKDGGHTIRSSLSGPH